MELSKKELTTLASALWLHMNDFHMPDDNEHYEELKQLYIKLREEIDHDQDNRQRES